MKLFIALFMSFSVASAAPAPESATAPTCPSLAGVWQGTCSNIPHQVADLTIIQSTCDWIAVPGKSFSGPGMVFVSEQYVPGGTFTQQMDYVSRGEAVVMKEATNANWSPDGRSLVISGVLTNDAAHFEAHEDIVYTMDGVSLRRKSHITDTNGPPDFDQSCIYRKVKP